MFAAGGAAARRSTASGAPCFGDTGDNDQQRGIPMVPAIGGLDLQGAVNNQYNLVVLVGAGTCKTQLVT